MTSLGHIYCRIVQIRIGHFGLDRVPDSQEFQEYFLFCVLYMQGCFTAVSTYRADITIQSESRWGSSVELAELLDVCFLFCRVSSQTA